MDKIKKKDSTKPKKVCLHCLKVVETDLRCSKCRTALYCSRPCQELHWRSHKNVCIDSNSDDTFTKLIIKAKNHLEQGSYRKAQKLFLKVIEMIKAKDDSYSNNALFIEIECNIVECMSKQGLNDDARELATVCLEKLKKTLGPNHKRTISSMIDLGRIYGALGQCEEAEKILKDAVNRARSLNGVEYPDAMYNLALVYQKAGKLDAAAKLFEESEKMKRVIYGDDHINATEVSVNTALNLYNQGRYSEAVELFNEALPKLKGHYGDNHQSVINAEQNLALSCRALNRYQEAETLFINSLEKAKSILKPGHPLTLQCMNNLAMNYFVQDSRSSEAIAAFKEYAKNLSKYHGKNDITTIKAEVSIAQKLLSCFEFEEANEILSLRLPQVTAMLGPENEFTLYVKDLYSKAKELEALLKG